MTTEPVPSTEVLTSATCWQLLRAAGVGRLAFTTDEGPDILPVNFVVDHASVVFRTAPGAKLAAASGRTVAFEVDGWDESAGTAWSVVVKGLAHEVEELYETLDSFDLPIVPWEAGAKEHVLRIEPTSVTGRRISFSPR